MSLRRIQLPTEITALWSDIPPIEDVYDILPRNGTWEEYPKWKIVRGRYHWSDGSVTSYSENKKPVIIPSGLRPFDFDEIDTIVVHHTASNGALVNQANYHLNHHKWPGLSYHLIIDEGRLKQVNDLLSMTFHAGGWNTNTVAVCINADLSKRAITDWERKLLYAAILTVKKLIPTIKYVRGHNEIPENKTACPCIDMEQVRIDIGKLELQIKSTTNPDHIMNNCRKSASQHTYLFNEYMKDPEGKKWLEPYLLRMHQITDEMGMYFDK